MIKRLTKNKKGFTLVEMIVVIAILAILAAVLVPTLMGVVGDANAKADEAQRSGIKNTMQYILLEAEMSGEQVALDEDNSLADEAQNGKTICKKTVIDKYDGDLAAADFEIIFKVDNAGKIIGIQTVKFGDNM